MRSNCELDIYIYICILPGRSQHRPPVGYWAVCGGKWPQGAWVLAPDLSNHNNLDINSRRQLETRRGGLSTNAAQLRGWRDACAGDRVTSEQKGQSAASRLRCLHEESLGLSMQLPLSPKATAKKGGYIVPDCTTLPQQGLLAWSKEA